MQAVLSLMQTTKHPEDVFNQAQKEKARAVTVTIAHQRMGECQFMSSAEVKEPVGSASHLVPPIALTF